MNEQEVRQYRKKPVVVEAIKFKDNKESFNKIRAWVGKSFYYDYQEAPRVFIKTLEGVMGVCKGDWIIKGVKGEFYSCKPDIFEATYKLASLNSLEPICQHEWSECIGAYRKCGKCFELQRTDKSLEPKVEEIEKIIKECCFYKLEPTEDKQYTGERRNITVDTHKLATAIVEYLKRR